MKLRKLRADIDGKEIWDATHKYMHTLRMAKMDEYLPHYILSVVAHVANMANMGVLPSVSHEKPFYVAGGGIRPLKLNMMMVAPAGFSKTTILNFFTDPEFGILVGAIPTREVGTVTSAGLVGSVENGVVMKGLASKYKHHIISAEEWTGISTMMEQKHSAVMQSELLKVLDSGKIQKNIKGMDFNDRTYMTLWAGVQNALFDVKSGFNRRFIFVDASPSSKDIKNFREARRRSRGVAPDIDKIMELRELYSRLYMGLHVDGNVVFPPSWDDFLDSFGILHSEDEILDKVGVAYSIIKTYDGRGDLIVEPNAELRGIISKIIEWRETIGISKSNNIVLNLVRGSDGWKRSELEKMCMKLGMSRNEFRTALTEYVANGILEIDKIKDGKGRPAYFVKEVKE